MAGLLHVLEQVQRALQAEGVPAGPAAELQARIDSMRGALSGLHASLGAQLREGIAGRCAPVLTKPNCDCMDKASVYGRICSSKLPPVPMCSHVHMMPLGGAKRFCWSPRLSHVTQLPGLG